MAPGTGETSLAYDQRYRTPEPGIRWWERVVGIFPDAEVALRLTGAALMERRGLGNRPPVLVHDGALDTEAGARTNGISKNQQDRERGGLTRL